MRLGVFLILLAVPAMAAPKAAPLPKAKAAALAEAEKLAPEISRMAAELWRLSETALKETWSAPVLASVLEKEGFRVERGVAGMPTAFVATFGSGKPVIGILAEYDALPGIGNEAVPRRAERADGVKDGTRLRAQPLRLGQRGSGGGDETSGCSRSPKPPPWPTQTTHKVTLTTGVHEYNLNRPLREALQKNLDLVGAPRWGEEEQRFARELQAFPKLPEKGLATNVEPLAPGRDPVEGGSTDSAEASQLTPTVALVVATAGIDGPEAAAA